MKKKLALALVFVMGLSFTACGKTTVSDSTNEAVSGDSLSIGIYPAVEAT